MKCVYEKLFNYMTYSVCKKKKTEFIYVFHLIIKVLTV